MKSNIVLLVYSAGYISIIVFAVTLFMSSAKKAYNYNLAFENAKNSYKNAKYLDLDLKVVTKAINYIFWKFVHSLWMCAFSILVLCSPITIIFILIWK